MNSKNTWCEALTVAQLKKLWESGSKIKTWNELDPSFPNEKIVLYGARHRLRNVRLFHGGDLRQEGKQPHRLHAQLQRQCADSGRARKSGRARLLRLRVLRLEQGHASHCQNRSGNRQSRRAIAPTDETILSGKYKPLSRPLFLYVNKKSLARTEVISFLRFYLDRGPDLVKEVHYIPLPESGYKVARDRLTIGIED